jgi:hypothetical protein
MRLRETIKDILDAARILVPGKQEFDHESAEWGFGQLRFP